MSANSSLQHSGWFTSRVIELSEFQFPRRLLLDWLISSYEKKFGEYPETRCQCWDAAWMRKRVGKLRWLRSITDRRRGHLSRGAITFSYITSYTWSWSDTHTRAIVSAGSRNTDVVWSRIIAIAVWSFKVILHRLVCGNCHIDVVSVLFGFIEAHGIVSFANYPSILGSWCLHRKCRRMCSYRVSIATSVVAVFVESTMPLFFH